MATRRQAAAGAGGDRALRTLANRYAKALQGAADRGTEHLELAGTLYEAAVAEEGALLMTVEHSFERGSKPAQKTYRLSDPKATLLMMLRWCNIWLPIPLLVCILKGCPPVRPPLPGKRIGCFLILCSVNVCPAPGAPRFMCVYLCL